MPILPGDRLGPYELVGLLGIRGRGDVYRACDVHLDLEPANVLPYFPAVHVRPRRVRLALATRSAGGSYARFIDINAKAEPGAPLVDEARGSLGVGRADARVSKVGAGSPQG